MARKGKNNLSYTDIFILVILIFFIIVSVSVTLELFNHRIVEVREINVSYSVSDEVGLDLDTGSLIFGRLVPGGSVTRNLVVENKNDFPVRLVFGTDKQLEGILSWKDISYLNPRSTIPVPVSLNIPKNYSLGNYSGTLYIKIYKS